MRLDYTEHGEARISVDQAWLTLLTDLEFSPVLLPFGGGDAHDTIQRLKPDAIILTGGNDVLEDGPSYSAERNKFELALLDESIKNNIPVLGICRGMQIMNLYGKGSVAKTGSHTAKDHPVEWLGHNIVVNSFHNFFINAESLSNDFVVDAQADDGSIEAFHHKQYPWAAIMWHPERTIADKGHHHAWIKKFLNGASL